MSIKDMPCVTVEQVTKLRDAAIKLEQQLATITAERDELKRIVEESGKQEPEGWLHHQLGKMPEFHYRKESHPNMQPLYAAPVIKEP